MLKLLRKKGVAKRILWVVAVIIIISFGFLGQAYLLKEDKQVRYAGKIFGKTISLDEFAQQFQMTQVNSLIQYGDKFWELRDVLNLEAQAWDRIIMLQEAKKRKIQIENKDVVAAIQNYSFFQRDGAYDISLYNNILAHVFRIKPRDFEEGVRDTLMLSRIFEQETLGVNINEADVLKAYTLDYEKVQVSYVFFPAEKYFDQVTFDEIQTKNYYLENKEMFLTPEKIMVEYIKIPFPEETEETVSDDVKEEIFDKAMDAAFLLNDGSEWDAVAAEYETSLEVSDFFSMEQPDLKLGSYAVIQSIFQLRKDQISEPLETTTGFIIARVKDRQAAHVPDYKSSQTVVKEAWIKNKAMDITGQQAAETLTTIEETFAKFKNPDFAKITKELGLEIHQTPLFARKEYLPTIGISRDFEAAAFSLTENNRLSKTVPVAKGWTILHLDSRQGIDEAEYEKKKDEVAQKILFDKKNRVFSEFLGQMRLRANLEDMISKRRSEENNQSN